MNLQRLPATQNWPVRAAALVARQTRFKAVWNTLLSARPSPASTSVPLPMLLSLFLCVLQQCGMPLQGRGLDRCAFWPAAVGPGVKCLVKQVDVLCRLAPAKSRAPEDFSQGEAYNAGPPHRRTCSCQPLSYFPDLCKNAVLSCGHRQHGELLQGKVAGLTQTQQRLLMVAFLGQLGVPEMLAPCVHAVRCVSSRRRAATPCCRLSRTDIVSAPPGRSYWAS